MDEIPRQTLNWLLEEDNPAVAVVARRTLLGQPDDVATAKLWARRNEYPPVASILEAQHDDGSWDVPSRDYQKYRGSLWQIHLLGELYADGSDERVRRGAEYAFSRQLDDGSWSASNMRAAGSIPCLTANVGRALARMGWAEDERVHAALTHLVNLYDELGIVDCRQAEFSQLSGYCHMLTPKVLLFLAEVPREYWPVGAEKLRDECVAKLRDKQVFRSLPSEFREWSEIMYSVPASRHREERDRFMQQHSPLHYGDKPGWLRFGYPLSYNSDALEALFALAEMGEPRRAEYEPALTEVRQRADDQMRWALRTTHNGKMYENIEAKGKPSKWVTLRALRVLQHFDG